MWCRMIRGRSSSSKWQETASCTIFFQILEIIRFSIYGMTKRSGFIPSFWGFLNHEDDFFLLEHLNLPHSQSHSRREKLSPLGTHIHHRMSNLSTSQLSIIGDISPIDRGRNVIVTGIQCHPHHEMPGSVVAKKSPFTVLLRSSTASWFLR